MPVKTVLIVDDDPEVHILVESMLKDSEWIIESTLGGEQALARLEARGSTWF